MNVAEINRSVNILAANVHMHASFQSFQTPGPCSNKLLIVEGQTDQKFIEQYIPVDLNCMVARKAFLSTSAPGDNDSVPFKDLIIRAVYGLSKVPSLITCPFDMSDWSIYGMVDNDFDDDQKYALTKNLFVTDTHDLETLMISSDPDIFKRIGVCIVPVEDIDRAFFISYQLGWVRNNIQDMRKYISQALSDGVSKADFDEFIRPDFKIAVNEFLNYVNRKCNHPKNDRQIKSIVPDLLRVKKNKKILDANGVWKKEFCNFEPGQTADFWTIINGHDVLTILRAYNEDIGESFKSTGNYSLNREFEFALIDAYNKPAFYGTKIYKRMLEECVVEDQERSADS